MRPITALLGILTITGLCSLSSCLTRQYHVVYDPMNWTDAQQYCRDKFTDLATIGSLEDVKTLNDTVDLHSLGNPNDSYAALIGLYDDINSWRWSLADQQDQKFRKWAPNEPSNYGGSGEYCTSMYSQGRWNDDDCAVRLCAICFDDTEPIEKYILIRNLTWDEAQTHCREKHTDLASVRNHTENDKIQEMIPSNRCWIGLYRDSWKWSDGSSYTFRDWNTGEPNNEAKEENCVSLRFGSGSKWEDHNCDVTCAFICHSNGHSGTIRPHPPTTNQPSVSESNPGHSGTIRPHPPTTNQPSVSESNPEVPEVSVKKQVVRIKVTRTDSLDLNNPAVKEAILEQFKQKLKDDGGTADIKLKWVEQSDGKVFHKEDKKKRKTKKRERRPYLTKMEL